MTSCSLRRLQELADRAMISCSRRQATKESDVRTACQSAHPTRHHDELFDTALGLQMNDVAGTVRGRS
jgi:hypothetical protein